MSGGRPTTYTPEIGLKICERLLEGDSLKRIAEDEGFPAKSTMLLWAANNAEFSDLYARTREMQGEGDADDVADIARKVERGEIEPAAGTAAMQGLKWVAGKRNGRFSDSRTLKHTGPNGGPVEYANLTEAEIDARLAALARDAEPATPRSED